MVTSETGVPTVGHLESEDHTFFFQCRIKVARGPKLKIHLMK